MATMSIKPIHIFRAGRHTAMSGATLNFSESDLQASASAYDPALHEAPIVVGHPQHDAPAYGWVKGLAYGEDGLAAEPEQVDAAFADMVRAGRFKRVSASFYAPNAATNPKPGVYYLRHVGFLGAQPPAIKGLKAAEFSDSAEGVVELEFAELGEDLERTVINRLSDAFTTLLARLLRGDDDTPESMPAPGFAESGAQSPIPSPQSPQPNPQSRSTQEDDTVTKEEIERREAELQAQAAANAAKDAEFAEREQRLVQAEAQAARSEVAEFVETLVTGGKVLPRDQAGLVEFMAAQDAAAVVEFGEGTTAVKKPAGEWLRGFLDNLPPAIDYAERGAGAAPDGGGTYDAPSGYDVDPERLAIHRQAQAYAEAHDVDYVTAVTRVTQ